MKTETPRARLKRLRAELRYTQQMNRVSAKCLRAGIAKAAAEAVIWSVRTPSNTPRF